ncbi:MAG: flagellin [Pseudobdellovibrionaceae bacterium]
MVGRIATFAQNQTLTQELMRLQSEYSQASLQESTGLKSQTYQGISDDTFEILQFQNNYDLLAARSENAQTALDRIETMYSSVSSMADVINTVLSDISEALSTNDATALASSSATVLDEVASLLNTQLAGRYLFAGSTTNQAPVDVSLLASTTAPTTADTSYYQGDAYIASVQATESFSLSYGVNANDDSFEKTIRALQLIVSDSGNENSLTEAYNLLREATTGVANIQASLSSKASTLDTKISENSDELNLLDTMISNIKDSDLAEITVKITEMETQLEAAYSISSKILGLKLSDYLK